MKTTPHPFDLRACLRDAIAYDDQRASLPHEHTATLAGSAALFGCALLAPRRSSAVLLAGLAGALLFRAAAGRDGLRRWADAGTGQAPS